MPPKKQVHSNESGTTKAQAAQPAAESEELAEQQSDAGALAQRARFEATAMSPQDVLQLQRMVGIGRLGGFWFKRHNLKPTQEEALTDLESAINSTRGSDESTFQLVDNRPEVIEQRKLQKMANNGHRNFDSTKTLPIQRMQALSAPRQTIINAVTNALNAQPAADGQGVLVFHPPTRNEPWEYTRTVQYTVPVPGFASAIVRGHIHYTNTTGNIGPGNMWISRVDNHQFRTPAWVVANFNNMPDATSRGNAVAAFNQRNRTTHPIV